MCACRRAPPPRAGRNRRRHRSPARPHHRHCSPTTASRLPPSLRPWRPRDRRRRRRSGGGARRSSPPLQRRGSATSAPSALLPPRRPAALLRFRCGAASSGGAGGRGWVVETAGGGRRWRRRGEVGVGRWRRRGGVGVGRWRRGGGVRRWRRQGGAEWKTREEEGERENGGSGAPSGWFAAAPGLRHGEVLLHFAWAAAAARASTGPSLSAF